VIVFTEWQDAAAGSGRPDYLSANRDLQGLPHVRTVRSSSAFGFSMVNVIFEDSVIFILPGPAAGASESCRQLFCPPALRHDGPDATEWAKLLVHVEGPTTAARCTPSRTGCEVQLNSVPAWPKSQAWRIREAVQIDLDPSSCALQRRAQRRGLAVERSNNNVGEGG